MAFFSGGNGYPGVVPLAFLMLWVLSQSWVKGQEYITVKGCENGASRPGTTVSHTKPWSLFPCVHDQKCCADVFWCFWQGNKQGVSLKAAPFIVSTLKKRWGGWWRAASLHFFLFHYAKVQFACSEITVQVRQCNKLAYNLHLRKKKLVTVYQH